MTLSSSPDYLLQHAYMIPQGFPMATYSNAPYDSASYPSFGQFMPSQPDHFISPFQLPFPAAAAPLYPPPSSQPRPRSPSPPKNDLPPSPWSFPNFADGSNLLGNLDPYMQGQILEEVENSGLMSTLSEFAELDVPAPFGLPDDVRHAPEQWSMVPAGPSNPSTPSAITPFETPMDVFHRQFPEIVTDSVWRPPEGSSADAIQDEVLPLPEASGLELANPEDFFPPLQPDPLTFPYLIPVPFQHQQQGDVSQHTRFDEDGERIELQEPLHYALHGEDLPVEDEDDSDFEGNITSSSASSIDQDEAAKQVPEEERRPEIVRVPTPPLPSPGSLADYRWPVGPLRRAFATMRDAIRLSGNFAATFQSLEHDLYDAVPSDSEDVDVADDDDDMLLDLVALAEGDEKIERVVDDEELQIYEEPIHRKVEASYPLFTSQQRILVPVTDHAFGDRNAADEAPLPHSAGLPLDEEQPLLAQSDGRPDSDVARLLAQSDDKPPDNMSNVISDGTDEPEGDAPPRLLSQSDGKPDGDAPHLLSQSEDHEGDAHRLLSQSDGQRLEEAPHVSVQLVGEPDEDAPRVLAQRVSKPVDDAPHLPFQSDGVSLDNTPHVLSRSDGEADGEWRPPLSKSVAAPLDDAPCLLSQNDGKPDAEALRLLSQSDGKPLTYVVSDSEDEPEGDAPRLLSQSDGKPLDDASRLLSQTHGKPLGDDARHLSQSDEEVVDDGPRLLSQSDGKPLDRAPALLSQDDEKPLSDAEISLRQAAGADTPLTSLADLGNREHRQDSPVWEFPGRPLSTPQSEVPTAPVQSILQLNPAAQSYQNYSSGDDLAFDKPVILDPLGDMPLALVEDIENSVDMVFRGMLHVQLSFQRGTTKKARKEKGLVFDWQSLMSSSATFASREVVMTAALRTVQELQENEGYEPAQGPCGDLDKSKKGKSKAKAKAKDMSEEKDNAKGKGKGKAHVSYSRHALPSVTRDEGPTRPPRRKDKGEQKARGELSVMNGMYSNATYRSSLRHPSSRELPHTVSPWLADMLRYQPETFVRGDLEARIHERQLMAEHLSRAYEAAVGNKSGPLSRKEFKALLASGSSPELVPRPRYPSNAITHEAQWGGDNSVEGPMPRRDHHHHSWNGDTRHPSAHARALSGRDTLDKPEASTSMWVGGRGTHVVDDDERGADGQDPAGDSDDLIDDSSESTDDNNDSVNGGDESVDEDVGTLLNSLLAPMPSDNDDSDVEEEYVPRAWLSPDSETDESRFPPPRIPRRSFYPPPQLASDASSSTMPATIAPKPSTRKGGRPRKDVTLDASAPKKRGPGRPSKDGSLKDMPGAKKCKRAAAAGNVANPPARKRTSASGGVMGDETNLEEGDIHSAQHPVTRSGRSRLTPKFCIEVPPVNRSSIVTRAESPPVVGPSRPSNSLSAPLSGSGPSPASTRKTKTQQPAKGKGKGKGIAAAPPRGENVSSLSRSELEQLCQSRLAAADAAELRATALASAAAEATAAAVAARAKAKHGRPGRPTLERKAEIATFAVAAEEAAQAAEQAKALASTAASEARGLKAEAAAATAAISSVVNRPATAAGPAAAGPAVVVGPAAVSPAVVAPPIAEHDAITSRRKRKR